MVFTYFIMILKGEENFDFLLCNNWIWFRIMVGISQFPRTVRSVLYFFAVCLFFSRLDLIPHKGIEFSNLPNFSLLINKIDLHLLNFYNWDFAKNVKRYSTKLYWMLESCEGICGGNIHLIHGHRNKRTKPEKGFKVFWKTKKRLPNNFQQIWKI